MPAVWRRLLAALVAGVLALGVAACGGDDTSAEDIGREIDEGSEEVGDELEERTDELTDEEDSDGNDDNSG